MTPPMPPWEAFIREYVHEDGTLDADFQGIYVIVLKNHLVTEEVRPRMVAHLCSLIEKNGGCLDTGFLSVPFLLDVLCENGRRDVAYQLLFQTKCPSWLYEVEKVGGTAMVHTVIPPNTTAVVELPGMDRIELGSGEYSFLVPEGGQHEI